MQIDWGLAFGSATVALVVALVLTIAVAANTGGNAVGVIGALFALCGLSLVLTLWCNRRRRRRWPPRPGTIRNPGRRPRRSLPRRRT